MASVDAPSPWAVGSTQHSHLNSLMSISFLDSRKYLCKGSAQRCQPSACIDRRTMNHTSTKLLVADSGDSTSGLLSKGGTVIIGTLTSRS